MKLLLVFALCGVTCCLAGPACTIDELSKCYEGRSLPATAEEQLDESCRGIMCQLEVYRRCGADYYGKISFPEKGVRKALDAICFKSSPLRKMYLENAECLKSATNEDGMLTMQRTCGSIKFSTKEEICRKTSERFKCAVNYINGKCGKDASDVFEVGALPFLDPYDCLSS